MIKKLKGLMSIYNKEVSKINQQAKNEALQHMKLTKAEKFAKDFSKINIETILYL